MKKQFRTEEMYKNKQGLICIECDATYDYPHYEVNLGLISPILALNFCTRVCYNKWGTQHFNKTKETILSWPKWKQKLAKVCFRNKQGDKL